MQVIAGTVASLGTSVSFATSAFVELEYTISLFEKFGEHKVAKHGLVSLSPAKTMSMEGFQFFFVRLQPLLRRIRERAIVALRQPRQRQQSASDNSVEQQPAIPTIRNETDDADGELLILRGVTRIVERHSSSSPSTQSGSLSPEQNTAPSPESQAETSQKSDSPPFRSPPVAHNKGYTVSPEDMHDVRSLRRDTQGTPTLRIPQADSDAWLAELQQILGPSGPPHHPNLPGYPYEQQPGGVPLDWPAGGHAQQSAASSSFPQGSTSAPMPAYTESMYAPGAAPDVLLNQTVSTEEWRQFMQQSGLADTPPFDFALDSFAPQADSATPGWQSNPMRTL